ncbi:MAG: alkaline phosphatase D family protein [Actinomycetota bacterium]
MTDDNSSSGLDRRSFLVLGAAATGAVLVPAAPALAGRISRAEGDVFTLGVASGDPLPDSVILWTRLAPKPLELDGGMGTASATVEWEIATDEAFTQNRLSGSYEATATYGHSVHVDVKGLAPDTWYYFRFKHGSQLSPTGRTRTTPELGSTMSRLVVGQTSCANWQSGYYQLYADLADQQPDYWLALGDYIYEYSNKQYMRPAQTEPTRAIPWKTEPFTIGEYRRQYGLYRSDADLQKLHAVAPYSVIWDDHEVDNNFTAGKSGGDGQKDRIKFLARRAAGFQAFWENHAIRIPQPKPMPKSMTIYRQIDWGTLATFLMLDGRQYRSDQPGNNTPNDFGKWVAAMTSPKATMLGATQEKWLAQQLRDSTSKWTFIGQQTVFASVNGSVGLGIPADGLYNYDSWDGYWKPRERLTAAIKSSQVRNPVILTGDFHCNLAFDVLESWPNPKDFPSMAECIKATLTWERPKVAAELAAGAISSPTFFGEGGIVAAAGPPTLAKTPWAAYGELLNNGYVLHEITPESDRAQFRICQALKPVTAPEGTPRADKTVVIVDGVAGVSEVLDPA